MRILDSEKAKKIITRMAWEIYEQNAQYETIVLAGVKNRGLIIAQFLASELTKIAPHIHIEITYIRLNKDNPLVDEITTGLPFTEFEQYPIIVVDDVANSGRTMFYALKPFMNHNYTKIQMAVFIERSHKMFPVTADFVGLRFSTTLQNHIKVEIDDQNQISAALL